MLNEKQLTQCKIELLSRMNVVQSHLKDHFGLENAAIHEASSELSSYDNHPADNASELFERQKDLALNEHEKKELADIEQALSYMEDGSYGKCEICHSNIPSERMMALPTTTRCLEHAEQHVDRERPIEEDILHPHIDEQELEGDDHTMFDGEDAWQAVEQYGSSDGPSDFYDSEKDFNNMFYNSKELIGGAEEMEGFLLADSNGNYIGVNEEHEKYEDYLDKNNVISILYKQ